MVYSDNNEIKSTESTLFQQKILALQEFCEANQISFNFKKYVRLQATEALYKKINSEVNNKIISKKKEKKVTQTSTKSLNIKAQKNRIRIEKKQAKYKKDPPIFTKNSPRHPSAGLPGLGKR